MKLAYSLNWVDPRYGGPYFSVTSLMRTMSDAGNRVAIYGPYSRNPTELVELVDSKCDYSRVRPLNKSKQLSELLQIFGNQSKGDEIADWKPDLFHDNGFWTTTNVMNAKVARALSIPYILSPRGVFDPGSLGMKAMKKKIAWQILFRRCANSATAFHATSEMEVDSIRALKLRQPIAVIPNGVDLPSIAADFSLNEADDVKSALFVGRIHPIKNLPSLLKAWALARPEGWRLKLAGPSEVGHRQVLETFARELGIENQVVFLDPVYGAAKQKLLRESHLFCLVSKSENFGIAAAEAMAAGLPVLTSRNLPWSILEREDAGWCVEASPRGLSIALKLICNMELSALKEMGLKGREIAKRDFGWAGIADKFASFYHWLHVGGEAPGFVRLK